MQDNSPQQWQTSDSKVSPVIMPALPDSLTSEIAGSTAYMTKDAEQENVNKTPSDTHITLAEACADTDSDDDQ